MSQTALTALSRALQLEQEGYAFYLQAAERVQDPTCKKTMLSLADDEKIHEAMIVRQIEALREQGGFVQIPTIAPVEVDLSTRIFPPDAKGVRQRVSENADELDALLMAMEIEVRSYDLYRQAAFETQDPVGREMYQWLASAEITHFNLLMSNYEAIVNAAGWI